MGNGKLGINEWNGLWARMTIKFHSVNWYGGLESCAKKDSEIFFGKSGENAMIDSKVCQGQGQP